MQNLYLGTDLKITEEEISNERGDIRYQLRLEVEKTDDAIVVKVATLSMNFENEIKKAVSEMFKEEKIEIIAKNKIKLEYAAYKTFYDLLIKD